MMKKKDKPKKPTKSKIGFILIPYLIAAGLVFRYFWYESTNPVGDLGVWLGAFATFATIIVVTSNTNRQIKAQSESLKKQLEAQRENLQKQIDNQNKQMHRPFIIAKMADTSGKNVDARVKDSGEGKKPIDRKFLLKNIGVGIGLDIMIIQYPERNEGSRDETNYLSPIIHSIEVAVEEKELPLVRIQTNCNYIKNNETIFFLIYSDINANIYLSCIKINKSEKIEVYHEDRKRCVEYALYYDKTISSIKEDYKKLV